jgi:hypothetical protein
MTTYELIRLTHAAAGALALAGFWLNATLRKGSPAHSRVGQAYLLVMLVVMATALPIAARAFAGGEPVRGAFLAYLVVITATPTWLAWRAIRDRRDFAAYTGPMYRLFAAGSIASGLAVLGTGLYYRVALLAGFSLVGIVTGGLMLRTIRRGAMQPRWWLREHYIAIGGCGVATHIAFLNIGLSRLLPDAWSGATQMFGWFGPLVVSVIARAWLDRAYGFAPPSGRPGHGQPAGQGTGQAAR